MTAKIDIRTPAGKSLEGFPFDMPISSSEIDDVLHEVYWDDRICMTKVNKGDTITIEIL